MKILQQLLIILGFTFVGKVLQVVLHLPIPGSVIGMVLLFISLTRGWVKECHIALVSDYLLEILSVLFIPAGVGLMMYFDLVKNNLVSLAIILFVSFVFSLIVVGKTAQFVKKRKDNLVKTSKEEVISD
ncbi:CidA/LrgA family protein [Vagococcus xieshaowenii]|uniref:CidA/LrgA family protein n=1 Tax=Vagococcus xieshaowenii TaxID=2562451 RepID=A0AAJ5EDX5_9ENTE|nr:CidA/LrgA family protein [Vagococcus xieshaowenii]QCA29197.1 CidA/LrgA family protein [Vagococcus xieshaowenii]TFZ40825.1 CidA/LrgA family protein [Vagococcus xieshaowenii]